LLIARALSLNSPAGVDISSPYATLYGSAGIPLLRISGVAYEDGISTPAGESRESARAISNAVSSQSELIPNHDLKIVPTARYSHLLLHDLELILIEMKLHC